MDNKPVSPTPAQSPTSKKPLKAVLPVVIGVIVLAGLGFGAYEWQQNKNAKGKTNVQITTKNAAGLKGAVSPQAGIPAQGSTTGTGAATATNQSLIKIPELGVQFTVPSSLKDITYKVVTTGGSPSQTTVNLTTQSLSSSDASCSLGSTTPGLGTLSTSSSPAKSAAVSKQVGSFYIINNYPQSPCSQTSATLKLELTQLSVLQQALNSSLQPIQ